jgi:hypothetical protein
MFRLDKVSQFTQKQTGVQSAEHAPSVPNNMPYCRGSDISLKTDQLMLYWEIIAVCSEIHTKHINTLCGQNVEFVNVKPGGTYSNHWDRQRFSAYRAINTLRLGYKNQSVNAV